MKKTVSYFATMSLVFSCFLILASHAEAVNFLYDTPTGNTWRGISKQIKNLEKQIPHDGGPRTSAEGERRIRAMREIVRNYDEGDRLFSNAAIGATVTNSAKSERQWYKYMANSCRIHSNNWGKNINTMERIVKAKRKQGK